MPLGPFDPIPPREKVRREHINDLRAALTGVQDAYLLYHAPVTAAAVPLPAQIGRAVTTVDSAGLTVANATVDASGVTVTVPGASGHAVVKLG